MKGQWGGTRAGAGRKPKREKYAGPIRKAEKKIADKLPEIADKLIELIEDGDFRAVSYALDRIMGKPTERREELREETPQERDLADALAIVEQWRKERRESATDG